MSHLLLLALWFVVGLQAGRQMYRDVSRYRRRKRERSHDALMLRIARLELQLDVGLDYAEKWLRKRPVLRDGGLASTCWGCGGAIYSSVWWGRRRIELNKPYDPELEARLCARCIEKAHTELELL